MKKMMKRTFSILLALAITFGAIQLGGTTFVLEAAAEPVTGTHTSGFYSYVIENDEANIAAIYGQISGDVIIPSNLGGYPVTSICSFAFENCAELTGITIPDSVISIGQYAFKDCTGLVSIKISDNVTYISGDTFYGCTGLTSIEVSPNNKVYDSRNNCNAIIETRNSKLIRGCNNSIIPSNISSIGCDAFNRCSQITDITIPDSVTSINSGAFSGCTGLTSITIPDSVTSIGSYAFYDTGYYNNESNWENGVLYIGNHLIDAEYTMSGAYEVKNGIKTIAANAFEGCENLTSITIPDSVIDIGVGAFTECSCLKSVTIPDSVTSINDYTFFYCSSLTSIIIPDVVTSIGSQAFSHCTGLTGITIPNSVTSIGQKTFLDCIGLTSITIPDSVTSIGSGAFNRCSSLTSITISDSATSIGGGAFYNTGYYNDELNWENDVLYIGNHLIRAKDTLSGAYAIKDGTKTIASSAFNYCTGLTSITIPDSVTSIGDWAFENCTGLTSITIPDSVTSIGEYGFFNCPNLTDVYYSGTESEWNKIEIGDYNGDLLNATIHFIEPTVNPAIGDLDSDGNINSSDALAVLRFAVGEIELTEAQRTFADVNNDGTINSQDALQILRYAVGEITSFD